MSKSKLAVLGLFLGMIAFLALCLLIWRTSWPKPGHYTRAGEAEVAEPARPRASADDWPVWAAVGLGSFAALAAALWRVLRGGPGAGRVVVPVLAAGFASGLVLLAWRSVTPGATRGTLTERVDLPAPVLTAEEARARLAGMNPPFVLDLPGGDGRLVLLASGPVGDPSDPAAGLLRSRFGELNPTATFTEGRPTGFVVAFSLPVEEYGLEGLAYTLARENLTDVYTLEPSPKALVDHLLREHGEEQVALFVIMRQYLGEKAKGRSPEPRQFVETFLRDISRYPQLRDRVVNDRVFRDVWRRDFGDPEAWRKPASEAELPGYLGEMAAEADRFRHEHAARAMIHAVRGGARAFAVCSPEMAVRVEPPLRAAFE